MSAPNDTGQELYDNDNDGGDDPNKRDVIDNPRKERAHYNSKVSNYNKFFTSLIAGGVAGAVAKTVIAPLDRTKINFQVKNMPYTARKCVRFLHKTMKHEGVLTLWRGNSATMARILPYAAIQYASHEQFKRILNPRHDKHLTPVRQYLAGSLAGVTSVTFTYPLDMVRARMAVTVRDRYHNIIEAYLKIVREEGWRTIFRGFSPTLLGVIPYAGCSFFTYETLKRLHSENFPDVDVSPLERLAFGAMAGLCGQTLSYPLDIVRRRMQTAGVTGHKYDYTSIYQTATQVIRDEGFIRGMYKGLSLNWIKGPIAVGVSFMTFDLTQQQLRRIKMFHMKES